MLALRTGWPEAVIAGEAPDGISAEFRSALHWALFAETMTRDLAEIRAAASVDIPVELGTAEAMSARSARRRAIEQLAVIRGALLLTDDEEPAGG